MAAGTPKVPTPSEFAKLRKALKGPSPGSKLGHLQPSQLPLSFLKSAGYSESPSVAKSMLKTPLTRQSAAQFIQLRKALKAPSQAPVVHGSPSTTRKIVQCIRLTPRRTIRDQQKGADGGQRRARGNFVSSWRTAPKSK